MTEKLNLTDKELKERLFMLADLIAKFKNPQRWFNLVIPEVERNVAISDLEEEMKELIG